MILTDFFHLDPALDGDWEPLIKHIATGGEITPAMRKFLVGVLKGELKRPRHRPPKQSTKERRNWIVCTVLQHEREGLSTEEAIQKAMALYAVDRRSVQRALKLCRHTAEFEI